MTRRQLLQYQQQAEALQAQASIPNQKLSWGSYRPMRCMQKAQSVALGRKPICVLRLQVAVSLQCSLMLFPAVLLACYQGTLRH